MFANDILALSKMTHLNNRFVKLNTFTGSYRSLAKLQEHAVSNFGYVYNNHVGERTNGETPFDGIYKIPGYDIAKIDFIGYVKDTTNKTIDMVYFRIIDEYYNPETLSATYYIYNCSQIDQTISYYNSEMTTVHDIDATEALGCKAV